MIIVLFVLIPAAVCMLGFYLGIYAERRLHDWRTGHE